MTVYKIMYGEEKVNGEHFLSLLMLELRITQ